MPDSSTIETIVLQEREIEETKQRIATISERMKEELESMAEYAEVEELTAKLGEARTALKVALHSNRDYNELAEEKGDYNLKLKDAKEILSDYLIAYFAQTNERQIELGPNGDARAIVLSGRLGKEQKYQMNLLSGVSHD